MSFEGSEGFEGFARKACLRCRSQKRKCDRALPKCSLCVRLRQFCRYSNPSPSQSASPASPASGVEALLATAVLKPIHVKMAVIQSLAGFEPPDIGSIYFQILEPWFPVIPESTFVFSVGGPNTWDDVTLEYALLAKAIVLLSKFPELDAENETASLSFMQQYFSMKSWIGLLEGMGINSIGIVQTRLFITLFEVGHGLYPAAYTSIGGTERAAEALVAFSEPVSSVQPSSDVTPDLRERLTAWSGIFILDKYIAIENGKWPAITHGRDHPEVSFVACAEFAQSASLSVKQFSRLFESAMLLERVHTALYSSVTPGCLFDLDGMIDCVKELSSYETLLHGLIPENMKLYGNDLTFCTIGLIRCFDASTKPSGQDGEERGCLPLAVKSLDTLLEVILNMTDLFVNEKQVLNFNGLSPFIVYLIYRAAAIVTESLITNAEDVKEKVACCRTVSKTPG
ncbi:fungal specific transcription factor [Phlyctema vagabunda]|uniref:Fungal specific transcription factor n=1 Tax=Phlyctema vagabunda TaxID=108571 RepID=A0ABR4PVR6_9HELO